MFSQCSLLYTDSPWNFVAISRIILSYKEQWQQFGLEMDSNLIEYPIATIRGPVPWKCNYQLANNRLDQVLMVTHPVLQAMNRLWYEL